METTEMNTAGPEGSQKEDMLSPSEENTPPDVTDTSGSLNFSVLGRFGISVQSFTPAASSDRKDKSRLAQIKARRRSSIGVRGSPETNSLIRFMAQQRLKTPTNLQTPQPVSRSPFLPRVASTLRQKMASFQSLMDVEESEVCDPMPRQDGNTGGCIKTRDYLSDGSSKENHPPLMMPSAKKRRCMAPLESCEVEIREASAPVLQFQLKEQEVRSEEEETATQVLKQVATSSETVTETQPELISPPPPPATCSPTKIQQNGFFELQSLSRPLTAVSPFHLPSLPGLLEMKPTDDDSTGTSAVRKTKRVRFGGLLSPELFDKNLPPSTPLQKGGTPARAPTPGGGLQLRSLLKTPQRSEPQTLQAQSDFSSPTVFGASPTLAMPRNFRRKSVEEDSEEDGKIVFPSMEEIDYAVTSDTGYLLDSQPLNLNSAFHEESLSQTVTESEIKPSSTSQMVVLDEPASSPEKKKPETPAPVRSNKRRKKPEAVCESTSEAPALSGSRKRKQPEESEPVKRSTRSAAKTASGKMKMTSAAARRWNRDVDRSLYGSREYASKNPTLSPITERLSFIGQSPAAQQAPSASCTKHAAPTPETHSNPETANSREATDELIVTHDLENPSEETVKSPYPSKESCVRKGRRLMGQRSRGRGMKKRKVSVAVCNLLCEEPCEETGGPTKEHCEDQTTTKPEASRETPLCHTAPYQRAEDIELEAKTPADIPSTNSEGKSECPASLNALLPSDEELNDLSAPAEFSQRKAEGRSSSVNSSVDQEQGNQVQEHQMSHEVEDNHQGDQAANRLENCRSSSGSQEEEGPFNSDLAPWQADFNFEDVFKSVTSRGQRSVRRSLRNQRNEVQSIGAGLAWLPRTSPDSSKKARRKTRGCRLSAALPAQPSVSEETQDNCS
ncbi:cell division cycle-associated protein 2 isoform X2 [Paralichthys olivaceus]|uniref:cell division cycle-associated protein 2 isoform X2 n=1 Tax=Paralichthys olivaceus TaxID=8255 RepID=UPI003753C53A